VFRPFKKARPMRRRRGRRSATLTSKAGYGKGFGYRGKKTSRRVYRQRLWNSTTAKTKFRSVMARITTVTAPLGGITQLNNVFNALQTAAGNAFWTTAGGGLNTETVTMPNFDTNSIVLRGGMINLKCNNENTVADAVVVKVWLYKHHDDFTGANWTGTFTAGFDPTMTLEHTKNLGRLQLYREFLLENNNVGEVSFRIPMMEINSINYLGGNQGYFWLTAVHAPAGNACNVNIVNSFSLSFVGDVV